MKIAFVGAVESSAALLRSTIQANARIVGLATLSSGPGRIRHSDYADLSILARDAEIPVFLDDDGDGVARMVDQVAPDCLFVFGWSRLVSGALLDKVPMGGIGFHPSPLPVGRGRHPLIWTILLGLTESAVSFMRLSQEADCGDIVLQVPFSVSAEETARSLMDKVTGTAMQAVPALLTELGTSGLANASRQDERGAVVWRKRSASDGKIDFRMTRSSIDRHARALSEPYPGADAMHSAAGSGKIWAVSAPARHYGNVMAVEPGRVIGCEEGCPVVMTGDGPLVLTDSDFRDRAPPGSWFC